MWPVRNVTYVSGRSFSLLKSLDLQLTRRQRVEEVARQSKPFH